MIMFIVLALVSILGCFYFMFIQYYVLMIEIIFNVITAVVVVLELVLGFTLFWQFKSYEKQT